MSTAVRTVGTRRPNKMPKLTSKAGPSFNGPPPDSCPNLEFWYWFNHCPETGTGQRQVHRWIYKAAHACKHFGLTIEQAHDWILERMTREPDSPREIPDTLAQVYGETTPGNLHTRQDKPKVAAFNPDKLAERIAPLRDIEPIAFLRDKSPYYTDLPPSCFLRAITRTGEWMVAMPKQEAFGGEVKLWRRSSLQEHGERYDRAVGSLAQSSEYGAWFLNQPVTGDLIDSSYRRIANVATWRHAVLECDEPSVTADDWLRFLLTIPFPIVSITHSGGRGAHALVLGPETDSKDEFQAWIDANLKPFTVYGADPNALTAHRLTRLPNCWRGEKRQWQTLYYLNPESDGQPIYQPNHQQLNRKEN